MFMKMYDFIRWNIYNIQYAIYCVYNIFKDKVFRRHHQQLIFKLILFIYLLCSFNIFITMHPLNSKGLDQEYSLLVKIMIG